MKKSALLLGLLLLFSIDVKAQWGEDEMEEKPSFKDRIFTGGGFGLGFGSYADFVSISPLVGYKVSDKVATGIGFQYRYTNYKIVNPSVSTSDYGIAPFVRYNVYAPLFLHAEYEYLNYQFVYSSNEKIRKDFSSFMIGGGVFQPISRNAGFYILALYNLSYRPLTSALDFSPYTSPWVLRAGITLGF
jgi:hypothetical protein